MFLSISNGKSRFICEGIVWHSEGERRGVVEVRQRNDNQLLNLYFCYYFGSNSVKKKSKSLSF